MTPAYSGEYQTFGIRPERRAKRKLSGPEVRLGDTENRTRFDFHHRRFCTIAGQDRSFLQNRLIGYTLGKANHGLRIEKPARDLQCAQPSATPAETFPSMLSRCC